MKIRSLHIHRLPGIRSGFPLENLAPGINVVVGPNASGKSSLMRALRAVLYREELQGVTPLFVEASFAAEGGELYAVRQGSQLAWQRDGQPADPPPLPDHRLLPCFTLRIEDLLEQENATDAEIAGRLARELAGGYEVGGIRGAEPFRLKQGHARKEAQALREAESTLRRRQQEQEQLRRDEARLAGLRDERDRAEQARAGADRCQRALDLLKARRDLDVLRRELAEFPEAMDKLHGDELEELEKLRSQRKERDQALQSARESLDQARQALTDTGLVEAGLDEAALADQRQALQQLQRIETTLEQRRAELDDARAALEAALGDLGGEPDRPVHLDVTTVKAVEDRLRGKRELDAAIAALQRERDRLPRQADTGPAPEVLQQARAELLRWLAAPAYPGRGALHKTAMISVLGAGLTGIVVAALAIHWALLALLVPFGWGAWALLARAPGGRERRQARERYAQSGQPGPQSWDPAAVRARMDELDRLAREARRRETLAEERGQVERELERKQSEQQEIVAGLERLAGEIAYDPLLQDGPLDRWLRLTLAWDEARVRVDCLGARIERLESQAGPLRTDALEFLAGHDESPETADPDAATLLARLEHLADRLGRRKQALKDIAQADRDITRLESELREVDDAIVALFRKAGLAEGDEAGLRRRLELRPGWSDKQEELRRACAQEAVLREGLGEYEDLLRMVEADDEESLRRRHGSLQEQAGRYRELNEEIGAINESVRLAGRERALEVARAQTQAAQDALRDRLEDALFATAGSFLLEQVEEQHVQSSQPRALTRAKDWFAHFTHHAWTLDFSGDGQTRFAAVETASGERRGLAELSSGTRMQLLLAVRVAFALEAERGHEPLPLVLDEALTTADPERFRAAAESMQALADDGRQVFYLTAQPADIGYWKAHDPQVRCIDLAQERRLAGAIREPDSIALPERPPVPVPDGRSAQQYAIELGVPPVNPWGEPASVHVFHLLRDDLPLLHRLLRDGIERLGQLESLLASQAAETLLDPDERERLKARDAAAKAWFEAWRTGRGRPVDRDVLEKTDAVSDTFLERVTELNAEVGGDARELLDRLEAGAVKGFRTAKLDELGDFLAERGCLDDREPLSDSDIRMQIVAATGSADEARTLAEWLAAGLSAH
ncbi:MAG TPA: hypothetical protein VFA86_05485 [Gammaproteobacteria bacterium]|nr:hypothetical protein [Gammaproteobacteria bacterium]